MRRRSLGFSLVLLGIAITIAGPARAAPDGEAKASFATYLDALSRKDGTAAAGVVTAGTLDHYGKMRLAALEAPAKDVRRLGVLDQVFVLMLRAQIDPKDLQRWSAPQLFAEAVQRGWIDASAVARASLGKIAVRGNLAVARMISEGQELPFEWHFAKEKGAWKNDLLHVFRFLQGVITQHLKASGKEETQFVREAVEGAVGRKLPAAIWDPPGAAARG
jgi:uncharacterized protein